MKQKRSMPRRRTAPQWTAAGWETANQVLAVRCAGRCEVCGDLLRGRVERHHRKRRRDGGDTLAQILYLHPGCHNKVTENPTWAHDHGYIVWVAENPLDVPVFWCGRQWVLLDDEGGCTPIAAPSPI